MTTIWLLLSLSTIQEANMLTVILGVAEVITVEVSSCCHQVWSPKISLLGLITVNT